MNAKEKIEELLEASEDGTITAAQVTEAGLHRSILQEFVKSGEMYRFGRGLYVRSSAWEDDFYLLQRKYGRGIYSHDTALYLLGYSDRTPAKYTMTFPKGYNAPSLKQENLIIVSCCFAWISLWTSLWTITRFAYTSVPPCSTGSLW